MPRISGILETALYVNDLHQSVEFYQRLFDLTTLHSSERLVVLRVAPGQVLLIMKQGTSAEPSLVSFGVIPASNGTGQQHVAFGIRPDHIDEWRDRLQQHAVEVESALEWPEGGHSLYFRDPDGHCIELKTSDWDGELLPPVGSSAS